MMITTLILCLLSLTMTAKSLNGVEFPDKIQVENKTLVLNGLGVRLAKKFFMKFKVYVAALYLENKSQSEEDILKSSESKRLILHFTRDVEGSKIAEAYAEGLKANGADMVKFKNEVAALTSKIENIKENQKIVFTFTNGKAHIESEHINYEINNKEFIPYILKLWIGKAPNSELKDGLLGH